VICVLGKNVELGVDLQEIKTVDLAYVSETMTENQWEEIRKSESPEKKFIEYWTIKESVMKADHRGLSVDLKSIAIKKETAELNEKTWYLNKLSIHTNYCAYLSSNKVVSNITLHSKKYL
jgi:4'-phosphopantetheinyl transferase